MKNMSYKVLSRKWRPQKFDDVIGQNHITKTLQKHSIFDDYSNLSTYLIPKSSLPELPKALKEKLGYYFIKEGDMGNE